jgi:SAM-dependent methyltransferase
MQKGDPFLDPRGVPSRLFDYRLRRDIRDALVAQLPRFIGTLLDVGCGDMPYKPLLTRAPSGVTRYIGLDIEGGMHGSKPDLFFNGVTIPLRDAEVNCAIATEVLEHCAEPEMLLREIARVLKPSGVFFFTVPFFWPVHEAPHDYHRFTPFALRRILERSGFEEIKIAAHNGWDASLAQMIGLWTFCRGMRPWKRRVISWLLLPVVHVLNAIDKKSDDPNSEGAMTTGFSGIARKRN